jgi:hypothetical protein
MFKLCFIETFWSHWGSQAGDLTFGLSRKGSHAGARASSRRDIVFQKIIFSILMPRNRVSCVTYLNSSNRAPRFFIASFSWPTFRMTHIAHEVSIRDTKVTPPPKKKRKKTTSIKSSLSFGPNCDLRRAKTH